MSDKYYKVTLLLLPGGHGGNWVFAKYKEFLQYLQKNNCRNFSFQNQSLSFEFPEESKKQVLTFLKHLKLKYKDQISFNY